MCEETKERIKFEKDIFYEFFISLVNIHLKFYIMNKK